MPKDRPLPKEKNKKVVWLLKDELLGKIMTKFVGIIAKTYRLLIDDGSEEKAHLNFKVGKTV